jgi:hypothetical protein
MTGIRLVSRSVVLLTSCSLVFAVKPGAASESVYVLFTLTQDTSSASRLDYPLHVFEYVMYGTCATTLPLCRTL